MYKIKFIFILVILLIHGSIHSIEPKRFRIRPNGVNVTVTQLEERRAKRTSQIEEAIIVKKLTTELEGRAVVLGSQLRNIDVKYRSDLAEYIIDFIEQMKNDFSLEITSLKAKVIGKKHFLRYGEQAYLLLLVQQASKVSVDDEVSDIVANFFDALEYALDTDTVSKYLN